MEQKKKEWYSKLLVKLKRIESGELSVIEYISEVEEKLRQPIVMQSNCEHKWKYWCGSPENKTHKCSKCGVVG